jgi:DNA adenine methylase
MDSPISWVGGKRLLRKKIIPKLPPHKCYVEVFGGAGWVLFGKDPSQIEVYNDINRDLVNLFQVIKSRRGELIASFDWSINSRQEFDDLRVANPDNLGSVERARRMFYMMKNAFGGFAPPKGTFGTSKKVRQVGVNFDTVYKILDKAHWRLTNVRIENLDYRKLFKVYDSVDTVFFLDPPYYQMKYYPDSFQDGDFQALSKTLRNAKGKFLMTMNNHKKMRELFKEFHIEEIAAPYSVNRTKQTAGVELCITNY